MVTSLASPWVLLESPFSERKTKRAGPKLSSSPLRRRIGTLAGRPLTKVPLALPRFLTHYEPSRLRNEACSRETPLLSTRRRAVGPRPTTPDSSRAS